MGSSSVIHTSFLLLSLAVFNLLRLSSSLPASISSPLSIVQEPALTIDGSNTSISLLTPQANDTNDIPQPSLNTSIFRPTITHEVSGTNMILHFSYTSTIFHQKKINALYVACIQAVSQRITKEGAAAFLPFNATQQQNFFSSVPSGYNVHVWNLKPYAFTWGDVWDLLWGLREWCGYQTCEFEFALKGGMRLGRGRTSSK